MGSHDDIFDDLKHNPRVCSNCFRLRHDVDPIPGYIENLARRTQWADAVTETWTRTHNAESDTPPGETVSDRTPTTVCACGNFSAFATVYRSPDDPLDKPTAIDYTGHLSNTLDALATEALDRGDDPRADLLRHDRDVLFDSVRYLKSKPTRQFNDDFIFDAATRVACRRATYDS